MPQPGEWTAGDMEHSIFLGWSMGGKRVYSSLPEAHVTSSSEEAEEEDCAQPFFPSSERGRKLAARAGLPAGVLVQNPVPSHCPPSPLNIQCSRAA